MERHTHTTSHTRLLHFSVGTHCHSSQCEPSNTYYSVGEGSEEYKVRGKLDQLQKLEKDKAMHNKIPAIQDCQASLPSSNFPLSLSHRCHLYPILFSRKLQRGTPSNFAGRAHTGSRKRAGSQKGLICPSFSLSPSLSCSLCLSPFLISSPSLSLCLSWLPGI